MDHNIDLKNVSAAFNLTYKRCEELVDEMLEIIFISMTASLDSVIETLKDKPNATSEDVQTSRTVVTSLPDFLKLSKSSDETNFIYFNTGVFQSNAKEMLKVIIMLNQSKLAML